MSLLQIQIVFDIQNNKKCNSPRWQRDKNRKICRIWRARVFFTIEKRIYICRTKSQTKIGAHKKIPKQYTIIFVIIFICRTAKILQTKMKDNEKERKRRRTMASPAYFAKSNQQQCWIDRFKEGASGDDWQKKKRKKSEILKKKPASEIMKENSVTTRENGDGKWN